MIKKILITLIIVSIKLICFSQGLEWVKTIGGTGQDLGFSITTDNLGNVYTTGFFQGTVDFDPDSGIDTLTSNGGYDIFLQKLDSNGNLIWAKSMGGNSNDIGHSITIDKSGNIYTTGIFQGTVDFDPGPGINLITSAGAEDFFIHKLDANGNLIWIKTIGGGSTDGARCIRTDKYNNVYTIGYFRGGVDFDPDTGSTVLTSAGLKDIFIQKLDSNGNLQWARNVGGSLIDEGRSISIDNHGNVYGTGYFQGVSDFDPDSIGMTNISSQGGKDIFILKLNANGNLIWVKTIGNSNSDEGRSLIIDPLGNVYTTGIYQGTVDFDPNTSIDTLTSTGSIPNEFIHKIDSNGNLIWVKSQAVGGLNSDNDYTIAIDNYNNLYTTGMYSGSVDLDPGLGTYMVTSAGNNDIFLQKLDANGNLIWAKTMGGSDYDEGASVAIDIWGNIYSTGGYYGTCDFDPDIGITSSTSNGQDDIYIHKLGQCFIDTSLTLNLPLMTANDSLATFQWINCDSSTIISGATNQNYTATANGSYAAVLSKNGCTDTSACVTVSGLSINKLENIFKIHITPNPSHGTYMINYGTANINDVSIQIYNVIGNLIYSAKANKNFTIIDLTNYNDGIYFLKLYTNQSKTVHKLIKQ